MKVPIVLNLPNLNPQKNLTFTAISHSLGNQNEKNANAKTQIRKETESDLSQKEKTYITELEEAEFAEVSDGSVRGLGGDDELDKGHLLGAHQIHGGQVLYELLHGSKFSRETNRN